MEILGLKCLEPYYCLYGTYGNLRLKLFRAILLLVLDLRKSQAKGIKSHTTVCRELTEILGLRC